MSKCVVIDNGAGYCRIGRASDTVPLVFTNAVAKQKSTGRLLTCRAIDDAQDIISLHVRRTHELGYLTQPDLQREIWMRAFRELNIDPAECTLILTMPLFTPPSVQKYLLKLVFEDFSFLSCTLVNSAQVCSFGCTDEAVLVIDSGFSFTHVIPVLRHEPLMPHVRRLNVGGKHLTNFLIEQVSYRHVDVNDEFLFMNHVKHQVCYCADDVLASYAEAKVLPNSIRVDYVFPNEASSLGQLRRADEVIWDRRRLRAAMIETGDTIVPLTVERFNVPESLFQPHSLLGVKQAGIHECVTQSLDGIPELVRPIFYNRVVCVGGNFDIPGLKERLTAELRMLVPEDVTVNVDSPEHPSLYIWHTAAKCREQIVSSRACVTIARDVYDKKGAASCMVTYGPVRGGNSGFTASASTTITGAITSPLQRTAPMYDSEEDGQQERA